jgi:hypothetical protein
MATKVKVLSACHLKIGGKVQGIGSFIINGERKALSIESVNTHSLDRSLLDTAQDNIKAKAIKRMDKVSPKRIISATLIVVRPFLTALDEFFATSLNGDRYSLS